MRSIPIIRLRRMLAPGEICHVASTVCQSGETTQLHGHDFFELFLIMEGTGYHLINRRRVPLQAGHLVFIRSSDRHAFRAGPKGTMTLGNVAFLSSWFTHLRRILSPDSTTLSLKKSMPPTVLLSVSERESLEKTFFDLHRTGPSRHLQLARFFFEAWGRLAGRPGVAGTAPVPSWLARCVAAMDRPEYLQRDLVFFQRLAGRTPEHFARTCRKHFSCTPRELLHRARVREAQRQLLQTEAKIIDVCYNCGFQNLGYFYRTFRKISGCTPRHWRLRHALSTVPRINRV